MRTRMHGRASRAALGLFLIDLLVAGGGPTGLAAAIAAAQRGMEVVVVEPRPGVIDKACGEGLMPGAVDALGELGVMPAGRAFTGIRYLRGAKVAAGRLPRPGLGVRRTVLHEALWQRAEALGVHREEGRVEAVSQGADSVRAAGMEARWLIAADGLHSRVRHGLGLDLPVGTRPRYGLRRHFRSSPWSTTVDVHWGDDVEAYVTPVGDELVGVALLFGQPARKRVPGPPGQRFDRFMEGFPELAAKLGPPESTVRGAGPFAVRASRVVAGRVLLVGDAAGYVDPITGEGIKLGVRGAIEAVEAIAHGRPEDWTMAWRALWRPYALTTRGLLSLSRRPAARRRLPSLLKRTPWLFDGVLRTLAE